MLSSRTPCVPIRTFLFYTLVTPISLSLILERPSLRLFLRTRSATNCILEFCVCRQTSNDPLFFGFYFYHFTLMQAVGIVFPEIINTVHEISGRITLYDNPEEAAGAHPLPTPPLVGVRP